MSKIKGVTVYRHAYMHGTQTHYFGYDKNNEDVVIHSRFQQFIMDDDFINNEIHEFVDFVEQLVNDIKVFKWNKNYANDNVLDGEEWRLTVHYKSGRSRGFFGMNAYPSNFKEFVKLCIKHNFAFNDRDYDYE